MKKLNFILIVFILSALFLSSCKKDSDNSNTNNNTTTSQASIDGKWKLTGGTTYDYLDNIYDSFTYYITFSSNGTTIYDFDGKYYGMDVPYYETGTWGWLNTKHDSFWTQYSTSDTMKANITTLNANSLKFYDEQGETYELTK